MHDVNSTYHSSVDSTDYFLFMNGCYLKHCVHTTCDSKGEVRGVSILILLVHNDYKSEPQLTIIPISTIFKHS